MLHVRKIRLGESRGYEEIPGREDWDFWLSAFQIRWKICTVTACGLKLQNSFRSKRVKPEA